MGYYGMQDFDPGWSQGDALNNGMTGGTNTANSLWNSTYNTNSNTLKDQVNDTGNATVGAALGATMPYNITTAQNNAQTNALTSGINLEDAVGKNDTANYLADAHRRGLYGFAAAQDASNAMLRDGKNAYGILWITNLMRQQALGQYGYGMQMGGSTGAALGNAVLPVLGYNDYRLGEGPNGLVLSNTAGDQTSNPMPTATALASVNSMQGNPSSGINVADNQAATAAKIYNTGLLTNWRQTMANANADKALTAQETTLTRAYEAAVKAKDPSAISYAKSQLDNFYTLHPERGQPGGSRSTSMMIKGFPGTPGTPGVPNPGTPAVPGAPGTTTPTTPQAQQPFDAKKNQAIIDAANASLTRYQNAYGQLQNAGQPYMDVLGNMNTSYDPDTMDKMQSLQQAINYQKEVIAEARRAAQAQADRQRRQALDPDEIVHSLGIQ